MFLENKISTNNFLLLIIKMQFDFSVLYEQKQIQNNFRVNIIYQTTYQITSIEHSSVLAQCNIQNIDNNLHLIATMKH